MSLREVTQLAKIGYTTFVYHSGILQLVKVYELEEEISLEIIARKWSYQNKDINISFDMMKSQYLIKLYSDESKLNVGVAIQSAKRKVAEIMMNLQLSSTD